jgi:intergrase/recombinase
MRRRYENVLITYQYLEDYHTNDAYRLIETYLAKRKLITKSILENLRRKRSTSDKTT